MCIYMYVYTATDCGRINLIFPFSRCSIDLNTPKLCCMYSRSMRENDRKQISLCGATRGFVALDHTYYD